MIYFKLCSMAILLAFSAQIFASNSKIIERADRLLLDKKYTEAHDLYDEAIFEADDEKEEIKARIGVFNSLKMSKERHIYCKYALDIISEYPQIDILDAMYLINSSFDENFRNSNAVKMAGILLKRKDLSGFQKSGLLYIYISEKPNVQICQEIMNIPDANDKAKAYATGYMGTYTFYAKKDYKTSLQYFQKALASNYLTLKNRQFFLMAIARNYLALGDLKKCISSFNQALEPRFTYGYWRYAIYLEMASIYNFFKNRVELKKLYEKAANDKLLTKAYRNKFATELKKLK